MAIVVFEGPDGAGKSTIIKRLKEKYPHFNSFAFPTDYFRELLPKLDYNNPQTIYDHHLKFEMDFAEHVGKLIKLQRRGPLLLDRYFISNLAYAKLNIDKCEQGEMSLLKVLKFIDHYHIPDLVIYMMQYDISEFPRKQDTIFDDYEVSRLQTAYSELLEILKGGNKILDYETIPLFNNTPKGWDSTFERVEDVLKKKGFI
jgi:thymidylate kinase